MRQLAALLREFRNGAFGEARTVPEAWRSWALYFGVTLAAGAFLAIAGAFATDQAPLWLRLVYWLPAMLVGSILGQVAQLIVRRAPWVSEHRWLGAAAIAMLVSIGILALVAFMTDALLGHGTFAQNAGEIIPSVLIVSSAMTSLMVLLGIARTRVTHEGATPARFLQRLPAKLMGGVLYAVQAEDHYLRLHTSKGQDLILFRLSDAIGELEGIEGMQTHRSWWVARQGVEAAKRGDGKVALTLKNGAEAAVSRTNVRALKKAGWI
jgi:hypothetical protein